MYKFFKLPVMQEVVDIFRKIHWGNDICIADIEFDKLKKEANMTDALSKTAPKRKTENMIFRTWWFCLFCGICSNMSTSAQVMEGSTGNSKNVPKKSTRLGRMMGFRQYTLRLRCEPKSLQPACTKFSNFVPILDTSTFTTPSFISSGNIVSLCTTCSIGVN